MVYILHGRRGGLMVSTPDSEPSVLGLSRDQGHCVVFLGKALNSHNASLHPGVCLVQEHNMMTLARTRTGLPFDPVSPARSPRLTHGFLKLPNIVYTCIGSYLRSCATSQLIVLGTSSSFSSASIIPADLNDCFSRMYLRYEFSCLVILSHFTFVSAGKF